MMLPEFEAIYEPYSEHATLEETLGWITKQCKQLGIPDDVRDAGIATVFLEMSRGLTFARDMCTCGCEIRRGHVDMNHYTLKKIISLNNQVHAAYKAVLQNATTASILSHIEVENARYIKDTMEEEKTLWQRFREWL
jgi:hypothetical protein